MGTTSKITTTFRKLFPKKQQNLFSRRIFFMRKIWYSLAALVGLISLVSCWEEPIAIDPMKAPLLFELARDEAGKMLYGDTVQYIAIGDTFTLFAKCDYPQAIKSFEVALIDSLGGKSKPTAVTVTDTALLSKVARPWYVGSYVIPKSGSYALEVEVVSAVDSLLSTKDTVTILAGAKPKLTINTEIRILKKALRVGDSASLSVHADSGTAPFTYKWIKDSTALVAQSDTILTIDSADTADAGIYRCEIQNHWGTVSTSPCTLTVKKNSAPLWSTTIPVYTVQELQPLKIDFASLCSDLDGDTLVFKTITGTTLPIQIGGTIGSYTPSYEESGTYTLALIASDGRESIAKNITVIVTNFNRLPYWDTTGVYSASVSENKTSLIDLKKLAKDLDAGDQLKFSLAAGSWSSASINGDSLVLAPTLAESGSHSVTISVADSAGVAVSHAFTITVLNTNQAPIWDSTTLVIPTIKEGIPFTCNLAKFASDKDTADNLHFALESTTLQNVGGTPLLSIDSLGNLTGLVGFGDVPFGTAAQLPFSLIATVSDGSSITKITLPITVVHQNRAPVWTLASSPYIIPAIKESETLTFDFRPLVKDPDGTALKFSFLKEISGITIVGDSAILFTPDYGIGNTTFTFTLIASDGVDTATAPFQFDVRDKNRLPFWVADSIIPIVIDEKSTKLIDLTKKAIDPDGDPKIFAPKGALPSWITLKDGVLTLAPDYTSAGQTVISLTVSDGNEIISQDFVIDVKNVNQKPVFVADKPKLTYVIHEEQQLVVTFMATDADDDAVSYFLKDDKLPRGGSLNTLQKTVTWNSALKDVGIYSATLGATDGKDTMLSAIIVEVTKSNKAPLFDREVATVDGKTSTVIPSGNISSIRVPENGALIFTYSAVDLNNDPVSVSFVKIPAEFTHSPAGANTGTASFTPGYDLAQTGKDSVLVVILDAFDGTVHTLVFLKVSFGQ